MKRTMLALAIIGLSGCVTEAVPTGKSKTVPAERVLIQGIGNSEFIVTRDNGWLVGGGCFTTLTLDGKHIARIGTGESISYKTNAGRHILGIADDPKGSGLCGVGNGQPYKETSTVINDNETQKFRISGDTNSGLDIRPTSN
ncbi:MULTISPECIES: hypothetical protein [Enterobacter]|uniref:hypothetical protein n=1 Tax=Enterobacter TaxID=547 RepID=UPI000C1E83C1|nr:MULTISPECIES: hypothetical protein [Enterobacter]MDW3568262.1 hypothetical protein [Enterobacter asburiae]PJD09555.1 hypothetical protein B9Q19_03155 [Enterobacter bugandensis]